MSTIQKRKQDATRLGLRLVAALANLQIALGIVFGLANYTHEMLPYFFVPVVFGLSASVLFARQPQFSAIFALIGSIPAVTLVSKAGMTMPALWLFLAPTLWVIALEHPTQLAGNIRRAAVAALAGSMAPTLPLLSNPTNETNVWWQAWGLCLLAALIFISFRCVSEGLHRSPRTLLTIAGLGPLSLLFCLLLFGVVDGSSPTTGLVLAIVSCFAPLGALLNEAANRLQGSQERNGHEQHEQVG